MNKELAELSRVIKDYNVDLEDFYVVALYPRRICLQADMGRKMVMKYQELLDTPFIADTANGFLHLDVELVGGIHLEITLA